MRWQRPRDVRHVVDGCNRIVLATHHKRGASYEQQIRKEVAALSLSARLQVVHCEFGVQDGTLVSERILRRSEVERGAEAHVLDAGLHRTLAPVGMVHARPAVQE